MDTTESSVPAALSKVEERMRSLVDRGVDAIIAVDEHAVIDSFKPAAQKLFGYAPEDAIGAATSTC